jgi:hypothetical protein
LAISLAVVGFTFGERFSTSHDALPGSYSEYYSAVLKGAVAMAIPITAIIMASLNRKHDETIALLRHFMRQCEAVGSLNAELQWLSYNNNEHFSSAADRFRLHHNRAFVHHGGGGHLAARAGCHCGRSGGVA